ncbi:helix-turn-helix domain-containing protein, partial [Lacrimispora sp. 38-1]|uniref:helix-turn-helix domain-containing protein n=1 Tax=Lacrimispora sp. 38-1 TaxID=3125778 RepID=UPI003CF2FE1A
MKLINDFYLEAGKNIRELRESSNYSREKLAELADISPKFLYEIEHGIKGFSADTLFRLSRALSVSCEFILLGIDKKSIDEEIEIILNQFSLKQKKELLYIINS